MLSKKELWEWAKAILLALAIVFIVRWLVFDHYVVEGSSMEPNFSDGQRIIVNKALFLLREPERGEVIILHAPEGKDYIKRVIATEGQTIRVDGDQVFVDGNLIDEPYLAEAIAQAAKRNDTYNRDDFPEGAEPATVPENHVFVMGDNRSFSRDSRDPSVGYIPLDDVVGRADLVFWPMDVFKLVDH